MQIQESKNKPLQIDLDMASGRFWRSHQGESSPKYMLETKIRPIASPSINTALDSITDSVLDQIHTIPRLDR